MIKKRYLIAVIAVCLIIIAIVINTYESGRIPKARAEERIQVENEIDINKKPTKIVAVCIKPIPRYSELSTELINDSIKFVEIPAHLTINNSVVKREELTGKFTVVDYEEKQQISKLSLVENKEWIQPMQRLKEVEIKGKITKELRNGNIVDLIVNYNNGDYDVVVPKVKIHNIIEDNLTDAAVANTGNKLNILIPVDEGAYRDITLAQKIGDFEVRLYIDSEQEASAKTFNYDRYLEKSNLSVMNSKSDSKDTRVIVDDNNEQEKKNEEVVPED
jgi:hypothetical protein